MASSERSRFNSLSSAVALQPKESRTMNTDEVARQLHDRATRGGALSPGEQALLEQWYAAQDQAEDAALSQSSPPQELAALRDEVDTALTRLAAVLQRIQVLTSENEALRKEIAILQRQKDFFV
jgi:ABC-type transporter Mla subunit MlaD